MAFTSSASDDEDTSAQSVFECSTLETATSGRGAAPSFVPRAAGQSDPPVHAAFSDQGGRQYQEDASAHLHLGGGAAAYGVFDGHGGAHVARYCCEHLLARVAAALAAPAGAASPAPAAAAAAAPAGAARYAAGLRAAFKQVDSELARSAARDAHMCGSTAAVCVVARDAIYTANCGAWAFVTGM